MASFLWRLVPLAAAARALAYKEPNWGSHVVFLDPSMGAKAQEIVDNIFSERDPRPGWPKDQVWESHDFQKYSYPLGTFGFAGYMVEGADDPDRCVEKLCHDKDARACEDVHYKCEALGATRGRHFDRSEQSRVQVFFKPGKYENLVFTPGYYHAYSGLGRHPEEVEVEGVEILNGNERGGGVGGLNNFWRKVENMHVVGENGMVVAVSQAAPLRRLKVRKMLALGALVSGLPGFEAGCFTDTGGDAKCQIPEMGMTSGGYMQDVEAGEIMLGSQQQFAIVDSKAGGFTGGAWSYVFINSEGNLSGMTKTAARTYVPNRYLPTESHLSVSKPVIFFSEESGYSLLVPALKQGLRGQESVLTPEVARPFYVSGKEMVFVALPDNDPLVAEKINAALREGKDVVLTPGIYELNTPIVMPAQGRQQVLLGLGFATLEPHGAFSAIEAEAGAYAPVIAGVTLQPGVGSALLDANDKPTTLLKMHGGKRPQGVGDHALLHDIFARVGGDNHIRVDGSNQRKVDTMVEIQRDQVLMQNLWLWRADHDLDGQVLLGRNAVNTGLRVTGKDVRAYGLAVEHVLQNHVEWTGVRGVTAFYQSELPYDIDGNWGFSGPAQKYFGYYASGANHQAHGAGVYWYPRDHTGVKVGTAIRVPKDGLVSDALVVYLDGKTDGNQISNVINGECGGVTAFSHHRPYFCKKDPGAPAEKIPPPTAADVSTVTGIPDKEEAVWPWGIVGGRVAGLRQAVQELQRMGVEAGAARQVWLFA